MEQSETIGKLVEALIKARGDFKPLIADKDNPFFNSKYADLGACIDATKEYLALQGLAVIQTVATEIRNDRAMLGCTTMLAHVSGEWIKETAYLPLVKQDPQQAGSAITYCRRYGLAAILQLVADPDDDANTATFGSNKPSKPAPVNTTSDLEF